MSEAALQARSARQKWAAAGGRHDRLIAGLRILLPLGIAGLVILLSIAPVLNGRDISFVLSKDRVEVAHERMRVSRAVYRGSDAKGQPFRLHAGSAVQATSSVPIVRLTDLTGDIQLPDGPATMDARTGRYDMDSEQLAVDGAVKFRSAGGYRLDTRDVTVDMKSRRIASRAPVDGAMTIGTFRANRLQADLTTKVALLTGAVHLHITQSGGRAAR